MKRLFFVSSFFALFLSGCGGTVVANLASRVPATGSVHSGEQPVVGASIQLYAVGTVGDGSQARDLLTAPVTTDSNGAFRIAGLYSCGGSDLFYITATGGDGGAGKVNPNLVETAALGACPSTLPFVTINEVTTVAAAQALDSFYRSPDAIGSSASDLVGLQAAFVTASQFASSISGQTPGTNLPSGMSIDSTTLSTLADIVSACVNSAGGVAGDGSPCGNLFQLVTPSGSTPPKDTTTAMVLVARYPNAYGAALLNMIPAPPPYQPILNAVPLSFGVHLVDNGNVSGLPLVSGANVQLPFTENGGTVAHDISGNGNDCTMSATADPASWTPAGYNHLTTANPNPGAYCQFPASNTVTDLSEANSRTRTWCGNLPPIINNFPLPAYQTLFGSSRQKGEGAFWMSGPGFVRGAYFAGSVAGDNFTSWTNSPLVGWHCVTETLGSITDNTLDRFYYDSTETSYISQGHTWDYRAAGDFDWLGNLPWDQLAGGFNGFTSYVIEYPFVLTPEQVGQNSRALHYTAFTLRGTGDNSVTPSTSTVNTLVCNGDSLANQSPYGTIAPCLEMQGLDLPFDVQDVAKSGQVSQTLVANVPLLEAALVHPNAQYNFASSNVGINDLIVDAGNVTGNPAIILSDRIAWTREVQALGYRVLWLTMIDDIEAQAESSLQTTNSLLRANAAQYGVTLVDVAEDACLGSTGVYANTGNCSEFAPDGVHMSQAGADSVRNMMANVVNYLTGSTAANPTKVSVSAYTMQAADAYLTVTSPVAVTLPSCVGYSSTTPFTITNQGSATSSVAPVGGQALDGGLLAKTLRPGVQAIFTASPLPAIQGGCTWTSSGL